jgi:hypothetical protein
MRDEIGDDRNGQGQHQLEHTILNTLSHDIHASGPTNNKHIWTKYMNTATL